MTALAGLWRFDAKPAAADACARMLASQQMYGPHGVGQWADGAVALGRALMKFLPEDTFDRQPLVGGGDRVVLVADLRIDNRDEIVRSLKLDAAASRNLCDAAILLAAYERWEGACLDRIVGDYAFALWDRARQRLVLARDPIGQRPLHYHRGKDFFAFASMPKGLHALPDVPYRPNEEKVAEFLALLPESGTQTFFQDIERVEPGHVVTVTASGLSARRYWEPSRGPILLKSPEEYAEALRDRLDEAVRGRLRATGGIGAHLSAGLDSSAVATSAARLLTADGRGLVAFTAVPRENYSSPIERDRIVDEGAYAAATAAMYPNIEHVLVRTGDRSPLDELDRNFLLFDRPMLNICNSVWMNAINDAARARKLNVLLTGQRGNTTLSYNGLELFAESFRKFHWRLLWREARADVANGARWRGPLVQTFGPWCPRSVWLWLNRHFRDRDLAELSHSALSPQRLADLNLWGRARERALDPVYRPWKDGFAMRLWVLRRNDPGIVNKGVAGGWQIDVRDPTADRRLIEFCLAVPTEQYLHDGEKKALANRALAGRLPERVLREPRKGYQAADWHERLSADRGRVEDEVARLEACGPAAATLDLDRLRRLVAQWPTSGWERSEIAKSYRFALLRGLSAGHFLRKAVGGNR